MQISEKREFYSEYDLNRARKVAMKKPAAHQAMAIDHLIKWYNVKQDNHAGNFVCLPVVARHLLQFDFYAGQDCLMATKFYGWLTPIIYSNRHIIALVSTLVQSQNPKLH